MSAVVLAARLLLAAVFAVAAEGKLSDRAGTRDALAEFGVPPSAASPGAIALPLAELAVAVLVLIGPAVAWGATGALVLLAFFTAAIASNLARGRRPDCHCFGQIHSAPAGASTLARNVVLLVVAGLVLWRA